MVVELITHLLIITPDLGDIDYGNQKMILFQVQIKCVIKF